MAHGSDKEDIKFPYVCTAVVNAGMIHEHAEFPGFYTPCNQWARELQWPKLFLLPGYSGCFSAQLISKGVNIMNVGRRIFGKCIDEQTAHQKPGQQVLQAIFWCPSECAALEEPDNAVISPSRCKQLERLNISLQAAAKWWLMETNVHGSELQSKLKKKKPHGNS